MFPFLFSDIGFSSLHLQFGVRVVMDSWKDLLRGDWEPQKIIDMLPKYMEFFGDFQNILFQ